MTKNSWDHFIPQFISAIGQKPISGKEKRNFIYAMKTTRWKYNAYENILNDKVHEYFSGITKLDWCLNENPPVNCGATVPSVSFENLREDNIAGLYCSSTGSTEVFINSDAACKNLNCVSSKTITVWTFIIPTTSSTSTWNWIPNH